MKQAARQRCCEYNSGATRTHGRDIEGRAVECLLVWYQWRTFNYPSTLRGTICGLDIGVSLLYPLIPTNSDSDLIRYMGQDQVYLQVIAESGSGNNKRDAQKVLKVLQLGRHWVLVSLLLSNVITNETLPIILDQDVKGGWFAVLASTILIVIFGEIIPQSICAKHGLAIGAWSSK